MWYLGFAVSNIAPTCFLSFLESFVTLKEQVGVVLSSPTKKILKNNQKNQKKQH
jgi:hypothetical protein